VLEGRNQSIVTTTEAFLPFGPGRHGCPGRFLASLLMKLMLAHVVLTYDVKLEGPRPANIEIKAAAFPDSKVKLLVRLRQKQEEEEEGVKSV
jgi:cytochrome P450